MVFAKDKIEGKVHILTGLDTLCLLPMSWTTLCTPAVGDTKCTVCVYLDKLNKLREEKAKPIGYEPVDKFVAFPGLW